MTITPHPNNDGTIHWIAEIKHRQQLFTAHGKTNLEAFHQCLFSLGEYLRNQ